MVSIQFIDDLMLNVTFFYNKRSKERLSLLFKVDSGAFAFIQTRWNIINITLIISRLVSHLIHRILFYDPPGELTIWLLETVHPVTNAIPILLGIDLTMIMESQESLNPVHIQEAIPIPVDTKFETASRKKWDD